MPRDTNGNTSPLPGTIVAAGDTVLPSQHNPAMQDLYAMVSQSLSRDGQGGMRQPLDMNNFPIRNVGAATQPNDAISLSQFQAGMPVGAVVDYVGDAAPTGWMLCFGQAISRTAYPLTFAACGVKFGAGDGSTTFNLPDLRGRVTAGKDNMGGSDSNRMAFVGALRNIIGGAFGVASHVLTWGQMPVHNHGVNDPGHNHPAGADIRATPGVNYSGGGSNPYLAGGRDVGASATGISIQNSGNNEAHINVQPSMVFNKIIKVTY